MAATTKELAEAKGLRSWDYAIPQEWFDAFLARTGVNPFGRIVWCYDGAGVFGKAVALDDEMDVLLQEFQR